MLEDVYDAAWLGALRDNILGFTHVSAAKTPEHLKLQCLALTYHKKSQQPKKIHVK